MNFSRERVNERTRERDKKKLRTRYILVCCCIALLFCNLLQLSCVQPQKQLFDVIFVYFSLSFSIFICFSAVALLPSFHVVIINFPLKQFTFGFTCTIKMLTIGTMNSHCTTKSTIHSHSHIRIIFPSYFCCFVSLSLLVLQNSCKAYTQVHMTYVPLDSQRSRSLVYCIVHVMVGRKVYS